MRRNNYFDYFFRERHSTEVIALRVGADALVCPAEQSSAHSPRVETPNGSTRFPVSMLLLTSGIRCINSSSRPKPFLKGDH